MWNSSFKRKGLPPCANKKLKQGEMVQVQHGHLLLLQISCKLHQHDLCNTYRTAEKLHTHCRHIHSEHRGRRSCWSASFYYCMGWQCRKWYRYISWFLFNLSVCSSLVLSSINLGPSSDAETPPVYTLTRVSTWRKTGHRKKRQTGLAHSMAFDRLSLEIIGCPISFRDESPKGPTGSNLFPRTSSSCEQFHSCHNLACSLQSWLTSSNFFLLKISFHQQTFSKGPVLALFFLINLLNITLNCLLCFPQCPPCLLLL